ncbi:MAG: SPFH domain-containing protein [Myxococcota bacterium]
MRDVSEKETRGFPGALMLLLGLGAWVFAGWLVWRAVGMFGPAGPGSASVPYLVGAALSFVAGIFIMKGLVAVNPNESVVLQLFGNYTGSLSRDGLRWVNPFADRRRLSVRARSFESGKLKVNDYDGNPIEIAAIVVYRVADTAKAVFGVEDYSKFVYTQTEAALRNLAARHPYDGNEEQPSLRRNTDAMAVELKTEIEAHVGLAGVQIEDAKVSHLAYAPEIAHAMLQRQQAAAIIAARQKIVDGAVGMVQLALHRLAREDIVSLDEERKAQMVANLLVVLCSERSVQPVVNAGTMYP